MGGREALHNRGLPSRTGLNGPVAAWRTELRLPADLTVSAWARIGSQIVTPDPAEMHSLVASGHFTLEGVLGYLDPVSAPGTVELWRLSEPGTSFWRLAATAQKNLLTTQGWHLDGPVGYAFTAPAS